MVKNLPAVQETQVRSLGQKDPLEKGTAAWEIPQTEEPGGLESIGSQRVELSKEQFFSLASPPPGGVCF